MTFDMSIIGKRILYYREARGINREKLAEQVHFTKVYVWQIEHGKRTPSLETFVAIANALQVSADVLLGGNLLLPTQTETDEIIDTLSRCSDEEFEIMAAMAKLLDCYRIKRKE